MPEICRFHGIIVRMYYRDHLPPHFHAEHGDFEVTVEIDSGVVAGSFPRRALKALLEWYDVHQAELDANWELARQEQPLVPIAPLE
jgi:hypothetical protein